MAIDLGPSPSISIESYEKIRHLNQLQKLITLIMKNGLDIVDAKNILIRLGFSLEDITEVLRLIS